MRQSLQLKVSQHLTLTPQLQQSIRLLQLSTVELNREIEQALQDNPLLELAEPAESNLAISWNDTQSPDSSQEASISHTAEADDNSDRQNESVWGMDFVSDNMANELRDPNDEPDIDAREIQAANIGLSEHLLSQLAMTQMSERERLLVMVIIEALDEDGYLAQTLEELADFLCAEQPPHSPLNAPSALSNALFTSETDRAALIDELNIALRHVQSFDPAGVAARSPQECLALQLMNLPDSPERELALMMVRFHLQKLAHHDFAGLRRALDCTEEALRAAQAMVLNLDPHPGACYTPSETRYIIPDTVVSKQQGKWVAHLNAEALPRLRINRMLANLLRNTRTEGGSNLSGQLQEARWLIKNIQQRFDTILRTTQAIVERQQDFFDYGEVSMRPLVLREIAEQLSLHESTISRVTTQKYLASPRGTFELKYFFGSHVSTDTGGAASSTAIRALIKQLVGAENGHKPLPDAKIAAILAQQGFNVARRTVAKYRESLNIPAVNLRKTL